MKSCVALAVSTAAAVLIVSAAAATPIAKKMTDQKLDSVVAGWETEPPGKEKGNNGWGNGFDGNNAGSFSGGSEPSKNCNCDAGGKPNMNPTNSDGR